MFFNAKINQYNIKYSLKHGKQCMGSIGNVWEAIYCTYLTYTLIVLAVLNT